jgi:hypothetical protein
MTKSRMTALGVVFLLLGGGLGALIHKLISPPASSRQVPGDPPVTIGDGSIHVHSVLNWVTPDPDNTNHMIIEPYGANSSTTGKFYPGGECGNNGSTPNASAFLWTDDGDRFYDISPAGGSWKVTIAHDHSKDGNNPHKGPNVTVTFVNNQLLMTTDMGSFDVSKGGQNDEYNRQHTMPDVVTSITVAGATSNVTWKPSSPKHPHYTLGFCYH